MRTRPLALTLLLAAAAVLVPASAAPPAAAAIAPEQEVVALVIDGTGFGHGRGLSQWGAFGRAVNGGQTWQQILDAYYGGTTLGSVPTTSRLRVRLVGHDGDAVLGVVSALHTAMWRGSGYTALQARSTGTPNRYDVYSSTAFTCPGATTTGWTLRAANVAGPIVFTTSASEVTSAANHVLGLCNADGSVTHYRGSLEMTRDSSGNRRIVNDLLVDSYLRGVVSREVSTSWGNSGGGAGMHALRAQAVAARSYGVSQNRYVSSGGYATTCDTTACQAYGGAARRATISSPVTSGGVCESGNPTFECANTNLAIRDTAGRVRKWPDGRVVATEFSASNGPRTAGGSFPAVDDPWDDVPGNPNHRWTRIVDGDLIGSISGIGTVTAATTEPDPTTPYSGVWDNRVRITGESGSVVIPGWNFRGTYGLPSAGFTVRVVTRTVVSKNSMRMIGDSTGVAITESSTSELPALIDGVFVSSGFDNAVNRCTSGCALSGVAAAANVPYGTDLVLVQLGYNAPTSGFASRIDDLMRALHARQVERVVWVNLSQRSGRADFVAVNNALDAARSRWADLYIADWRTFSAGSTGNRNRWIASDGVHLTSTGQAELARFLRDQLLPRAKFSVGESMLARDQATGVWGVFSVNAGSMRLRTSGTWPTTYDFMAAGDFDRDRGFDDVVVWSRSSRRFMFQRMSNYAPILRTEGEFPAGYDDAVVGDFDSDGIVNDVALWRHSTGAFRFYSTSAFTPTFRNQTTVPTIYNQIAMGDFDGDGHIDDAFFWNRQYGAFVVRSFSQFGSTVRANGSVPRGYDDVVTGDWDDDGQRDDLLLIDYQTGTAVTYSTSAGVLTFRSSASFSSTFDVVAAADLDDDGHANELLLFDHASRGWQIHTWTNFRPTLARAGTWPAAYDDIVVGTFG